jgi:hypothetical protein
MPPTSTNEFVDVKRNVDSKPRPAVAGAKSPIIRVEKGSTLTLSNVSADCPDFEVQVVGSSEKLQGNKTNPIVLHMPLQDKTIEFHVRHKDESGRVVHEEMLAAHTCGPC